MTARPQFLGRRGRQEENSGALTNGGEVVQQRGCERAGFLET